MRERVVLAGWAGLVGPVLAEHSRAEAITDGVLQVRCDTTTWATQLRLLAGQVMARLQESHPGVVVALEITGPRPVSWSKGPRRVRGRGPRDTYG